MFMKRSEQYVQHMLDTRYGISLSKIDEADGRGGPTPDFEYIKDGRRIFVCELKDFEMVTPSEDTGWEITYHPDGSTEATRASNAINRVGRVIYRAYKQLKKYREPKVMIFFNSGAGLDVRDLEETIRGFSTISVGSKTYVYTYPRRVSEGIIKDIKRRIDLYIWIDAANPGISSQQDEIYFRSITTTGQDIALNCFGVQ